MYVNWIQFARPTVMEYDYEAMEDEDKKCLEKYCYEMYECYN